jgi:hypothetical protein
MLFFFGKYFNRQEMSVNKVEISIEWTRFFRKYKNHVGLGKKISLR